MSILEQRYQQVKTRIAQSCERHQVDVNDVRLLAVSKTKPAEMIETLYQHGQRNFGENYVQDAHDKIQALTHLSDIQWHFIGPIQSNKTRLIAENFDWVETLDREKIAQRLNQQRPEHLAALKVLIQVNISREPQKSGVLPECVAQLANCVAQQPNLSLSGLMCIGESTTNETILAQQFDEMAALRFELVSDYPGCEILSMGMSNDLELAIKHGSTQVRIGSDIFGRRD